MLLFWIQSNKISLKSNEPFASEWMEKMELEAVTVGFCWLKWELDEIFVIETIQMIQNEWETKQHSNHNICTSEMWNKNLESGKERECVCVCVYVCARAKENLIYWFGLGLLPASFRLKFIIYFFFLLTSSLALHKMQELLFGFFFLSQKMSFIQWWFHSSFWTQIVSTFNISTNFYLNP